MHVTKLLSLARGCGLWFLYRYQQIICMVNPVGRGGGGDMGAENDGKYPC